MCWWGRIGGCHRGTSSKLPVLAEARQEEARILGSCLTGGGGHPPILLGGPQLGAVLQERPPLPPGAVPGHLPRRRSGRLLQGVLMRVPGWRRRTAWRSTPAGHCSVGSSESAALHGPWCFWKPEANRKQWMTAHAHDASHAQLQAKYWYMDRGGAAHLEADPAWMRRSKDARSMSKKSSSTERLPGACAGSTAETLRIGVWVQAAQIDLSAAQSEGLHESLCQLRALTCCCTSAGCAASGRDPDFGGRSSPDKTGNFLRDES